MEQTKYYKVDAEVPGSIIDKSTIDRTDIATSVGEFIVTEDSVKFFL